MKLSSFILPLTVLLLTGCRHKADTPTEQPPVRVTVMAIHNGDYNGSRTYSGTVASASTTTVSFAVAGTIEELNVVEGQRVVAGQLLGKIKSGDYTNADNIAQAELAQAQDAYNRLKKLHDANALPDIKWVEVQQKLKQAQNAADIARRALSETILRAPISGVISRKMADKGQNVAPVEPVYEIVSTDNLTIDISVPETEVGLFTAGQSASVDFKEAGKLSGKVSQKSVVADPLTRSYTVKVTLPATDGKVLPGMLGTVVFEPVSEEDLKVKNEIMLPSQAVNLSDDNRTFVWIVRDGKAERRFVDVDELVAGGIVVMQGLAPDDSVITEGMQKVGTGTRVVAVNN